MGGRRAEERRAGAVAYIRVHHGKACRRVGRKDRGKAAQPAVEHVAALHAHIRAPAGDDRALGAVKDRRVGDIHIAAGVRLHADRAAAVERARAYPCAVHVFQQHHAARAYTRLLRVPDRHAVQQQIRAGLKPQDVRIPRHGGDRHLRAVRRGEGEVIHPGDNKLKRRAGVALGLQIEYLFPAVARAGRRRTVVGRRREVVIPLGEDDLRIVADGGEQLIHGGDLHDVRPRAVNIRLSRGGHRRGRNSGDRRRCRICCLPRCAAPGERKKHSRGKDKTQGFLHYLFLHFCFPQSIAVSMIIMTYFPGLLFPK